MRKLFLLGMLFAASVCNAQVVLWDGEEAILGSKGGCWDRCTPSVVENPEKTVSGEYNDAFFDRELVFEDDDLFE